uniref:Uncharacterized protein n=1 Tax=Anguilla anguilla TaxID=7936 RepID=A0A0E9XX60_ANGAN
MTMNPKSDAILFNEFKDSNASVLKQRRGALT